MLLHRSCAGVAMDVKQLVNMLPQNLWFELFRSVALGKTLGLTFWVSYLQGKADWWW